MTKSSQLIMSALSIAVALTAGTNVLLADTFPVAEVRANGLTVHWQSQYKVDVSRDKIIDTKFHVHDDEAVSYFELRYGGHRETIGFNDLGPRGVPFGKEGAEEWVELRKEILAAEGFDDVTVELITRPVTTIYTLSGYGDVAAMDAETGAIRWTTRVGAFLDPAVGVAANNEYVVIVKGPHVYCLDAENGNPIWDATTRFAPGGGVSASEKFVYITSTSGQMEVFPIETGRGVRFFGSRGAATRDPVVTGESVCWATQHGYLNVVENRENGRILYRLKTGDRFDAGGVQARERIVVPSVLGKVFAVNEDAGEIDWQIAIGEPVEKNPIYVGNNRIALITQYDNLIMLDAFRGEFVESWPRAVPGIDKFVGASKSVLYFITTSGQLLGLDRQSGVRVLSTSVGSNTRVVTNAATDRLYLADDDGYLVCLREEGNINPYVHSDEFEAAASPFDEEPAMDAAEGETVDPSDPFADAEMETADPNDPFASGSEAAADPDDPFAEDNQSGTADPDDPFSNDDGDDDMTGDDDDPFADDGDTGAGEGDDPFADDGDSGSSDDDASDDDDDPFGGG